MRNLVRALLVALLILSSVVVWNCSSGEHSLPWATDQYGRFHTRDIERAQEEIPFQIVLPSYLPHNIGQYPYITGPLEDACPADKSEVTVTYQTEEAISTGFVIINEYNYPVLPGDPELNPYIEIFKIDGVEVANWEHTLSPTGGEPIDIPGFIYMWSQDNIYFKVDIYGFGHREAIKIIESMIE